MIGSVVAAALWALVAGLILSLILGLLVAGLIALARPAAATRGALWSVALAVAGVAPVAILAVMLVRGAMAGPTAEIPPAAGSGADRTGATARAHAAARGATALRSANPAPALRVPGPPTWPARRYGNRRAVGARRRNRPGRTRAERDSRARPQGPLEPARRPTRRRIAVADHHPGAQHLPAPLVETETPIAVGFRRPVILLPTEMATADGLTSIEPLIMHEYAHLARYDDWANLAQRITERLSGSTRWSGFSAGASR